MAWFNNNQSRDDGEIQDRMQEESDNASLSPPHLDKEINRVVGEVKMQAAAEKAEEDKKKGWW